MKNKAFLVVTFLLIIMGLFGGLKTQRVDAVSEICTGVATEFSATYPASVVAGQVINLTNISSRPANSYGFTITSSTLNLTATGAIPATYTNTNTSTDPSPTTGAPTYTAYYPNWSLTATGAAGSKIVVRLSSATAQVADYGPIVCPLTATLATINITAAQTPVVNNNTPSTTPQTPTASDPATTTTSPQLQNQKTETTTKKPESPSMATEIKEESVTEELSKAMDLTITVNDRKGHAVKGAAVTIDNQLMVNTLEDGTAMFDDIRIGEHKVTVTYGSQKIEQTIRVDPAEEGNNIVIVFPTKSYQIYMIVAGIVGTLVVMILLLVTRKRNHSKTSFSLPFLHGKANTIDSAQNTLNKSPSSSHTQAYSPVVIKPQSNETIHTVDSSTSIAHQNSYSRHQ